MFDYPQSGLHFSVVFELLVQFPNDIRFQEVSGLSVSTEFESVEEGGENRFTHHLPQRQSYGELTLKRGKFLGSGVLHWARKALENFEYEPTNLMVSLLNEQHLPVFNWYVVNAVPKRLEVSGINATSAEIVVETMVLSYQYFRYFDPVSAGLDLAGSISASASVGI